MKASEKIIELQAEKKKLEGILYSLRGIFFGREAYTHDFSELIEEVQLLMSKMKNMEGRRDTAIDLLQQENYRLYLLIRFLSGDKDAFNPITGIDMGRGLPKFSPNNENL